MTHPEPNSSLFDQLKDKEFRDTYVFEHMCTGIPFQIRALRKQRGWNQTKLAEVLGKTQSMVSEIENEDEGRFQLKTLMEIASAFDVALLVKFVSYRKLLTETADLSPSGLGAKSFTEDFGEKEDGLLLDPEGEISCQVVSVGAMNPFLTACATA